MDQHRKPPRRRPEPATRSDKQAQSRQRSEGGEDRLPGECPPKPVPSQNHPRQAQHLGQKREARVDIMRQHLNSTEQVILLGPFQVVLLDIEIVGRLQGAEQHREQERHHRDQAGDAQTGPDLGRRLRVRHFASPPPSPHFDDQRDATQQPKQHW